MSDFAAQGVESFRVLFARRDASTPPPKIVRMIPKDERAATVLGAVVQPCVGSTELADGSVEVESPKLGAVDVDYQGGDLLVFEPDASPAGLAVAGAYSFPIEVTTGVAGDPTLVLLPEGALYLTALDLLLDLDRVASG